MLPTVLNFVKRFVGGQRANVTITFALASLPVFLLIGMSVDYSLAGRREAKLNAVADAAALAATTPAMMVQTPDTAKAAAIAMFNAQANSLSGVTVDAANLSVKVVDSAGATATVRTATVSYTAASQNAFATLLKMKTMTIGGTSQSSANVAPNINFYLLIDTSPSMGIAATTAGINTMVANTSQQGGCAFACHETNPAAGDVVGNPVPKHSSTPEDNYTLARNLGVTLRIDLVQTAVSSMISTAIATGSQNNAKYQIGTYTFDTAFNTITKLTSNLSQAQSDAANIQMLEVYGGNNLTKTNDNNDEDTQFDTAMNSLQIANPGNGTNQVSDSPQAVLFIVTDGVIDELYAGGRKITTIGGTTDWCTPLRSRGVRIAILYTTYNPLPTNAFYNDNVAPFQPNIGTALSQCASPGLYTQVSTDGDITAAINNLFANAVKTAHLTQ
ncbi:TadE/TadG family type IV pilus assembly protein [Beijerinckia sp. L45]|uniref:TadE/TadG family type IV pilus assembly protein n=1 Tax=Beijerinckia sp. L45 TaxID=1641855 RepID=UPI00131D196B|nr:pilus assembly protein TadG-related protein [Beijerinckia sp. L45]